MKILIWVGYQNPYWNKNTWENKGLGGSEYCALKLAEYLSKLGHNVIVSGDVIKGKFGEVQYLHYNKFLECRGPVSHINPDAIKVYSHFDVVIGANYIHYLKHLEEYHITFDQSYFWIHNPDYYKWYKGSELPFYKSYFKSPKLNKILGVSKFHEKLLVDNSESLFNYDISEALEKIDHIDNAIDVNDYTNPLDDKIKGRIVWSSTPDRGLDFIIQNWNKWKEKRPDLSLVICFPPYAKNWSMINIEGLKDVELRGAMNPTQLREIQSKAEYWIYVSNYTETYCITALEMMLQKVKIITNGPGNIKKLINRGGRGILINDIDSDVVLEKLLDKYDNKMIDKAYDFALQQSWENRTLEWLNIIENETEKV